MFVGSLRNRSLWTPERIDTALWLDAADSSTVTVVDGGVSEWRDKSGNNKHAQQPTSSSRPFYTTSVNGKPVITFLGAQEIYADSVLLGDMASVGQRSDITEPLVELNFYDAYSRGLWGYYPDFETHRLYGVNGGQPIYNVVNQSPNSTIQSPVLVVGIDFNRDYTSGLRIGYGSPGYTSLNGFVAEIVIGTASFSVDTRQKLEGYLAHKWGLTTNLPTDHPYKNYPPRGL